MGRRTTQRREDTSFSFSLFVFRLDNLERVESQVAEEIVRGGRDVDPYPVFAGHIVRLDDTVVKRFKLLDALGLTLQSNDAKVVAVEE